MKFKKFMATALTVASVAGISAVPAFADDEIGINEQNNTVSTNINVETQVSDVSIVIPTSFDILFDSSSTNSYTPTNFSIWNKSNINIYIDSITMTANDDWELLDENYPASRINNDSKQVLFAINGKYFNPDEAVESTKVSTIQFEDPNNYTDENNVFRIDRGETNYLDFEVSHGSYSQAQKFNNAFTMTTKFKFMK